MILQPSCSPKKLTLVPTTGPKSRSTGCDRALKPAMKRASTLVGCTGASEAPTSDSACSLRRRENRSESATDLGEQRSLETLARIQRSQTRSASAPPLGAEPKPPPRSEPSRAARTPSAAADPVVHLCAACRRCHGNGHPRQSRRVER